MNQVTSRVTSKSADALAPPISGRQQPWPWSLQERDGFLPIVTLYMQICFQGNLKLYLPIGSLRWCGSVKTILREDQGGCLNIKLPSYRYRDIHVKDKTVSPTVLSLTWESPYMGKTVIILGQSPGPLYPTQSLP